MSAAGRTSDGRFAKGHSGNSRGRPRSGPDDTTVASPAWDTVLDIANEIIPVQIEGYQRRKRMTRFEASLWQLGSGNPESRSPLLAFIHLVRMAARMQALLDNPPRRYPATPEDYAELEAAAASGSFDEWEVAFDRFVARLPGIEEMSDRELEKNLERGRAGKSLKMPREVEARISELIDVLNRPR